MREVEWAPVRNLREKPKKKQRRSSSVRFRYDFGILLYFLILDCSTLFLDDFWVHLLIGVDVKGHLFALLYLFFLCACSVRASCFDIFAYL